MLPPSGRDQPAGEQECPTCAGRNVAPDIPHTRRSCPDCGGPIYGLPGREGLQVEEGDQIVFPEGSIRLSLDRSLSTGRFSRPGLAWFVNRMLSEPISGRTLEDNAGLQAALDRYDEVVGDVLERSSLLEGLDLESTPGLQEAVRRIGDNQQLPEWWAMRLGAAIYETQKGLEEGNAQQAAWGALLATTAWSMLVFIQQLEPLVWHGYQTYGVGVLQRVLDVWEDNQSTSNEEFWQSFFDEYPFIVSQVLAFPVVVVENKAYVGGKTISDTGGHIVDFLLAHQLTQNVALLEIKTPTSGVQLSLRRCNRPNN
jgi:hypothetical protein